jgi:hypothetical protein
MTARLETIMWTVWITISFAVLAVFAALGLMLPAFRSSSLGWRLLGASGLPLGVAGVAFVARFWNPTPGPYLANELYPYGTHLNAWAVSFGFTWLAFGVLFAGLTLLGSRGSKLVVWATLVASWLVCWLPHGVIGLAFTIAGHNEPSAQAYRQWASTVRGFWLVLGGSFALLAHFGLSIAGFILTGYGIWRDLHQRSTSGLTISNAR